MKNKASYLRGGRPSIETLDRTALRDSTTHSEIGTAMASLDDALLSLLDCVSGALEHALERLRTGDSAGGVEKLEVAVYLCEQHPGFACSEIALLDSTIQTIVANCVMKAATEGVPQPTALRLAQRLALLPQRLH